MAKRINAYRADDGSIFDTAEACEAYELNILRTASVEKFIENSGLHASVYIRTEDGGQVALSEFLMENADDLVKALSVRPSGIRGPKPRGEGAKKTAAKPTPTPISDAGDDPAEVDPAVAAV